VTHEWIDAGGLRTHVALAGPEDAPPLLLVHGWPQHWWAWRHVIAAVSDRYRVIAPDLRGHGWTDAPKSGYSKDQFATDLLALLDAMGIDKVTWVGHDWGAFSGFLAALRAPERFERFIPLCVPPPFSRDRSVSSFLLVASYQVPLGAPLLGRFLARHGAAARVLRAARAKGSSWTDEEVRTYDDVFRARPHVTVAVYRTFFYRELPGLVRGKYLGRTLEVPTTLLVGDRDLVTRTVRANAYPDQPQLSVQRIDGVGHFLPEEDPDAVIAALS
jgi:pimeloyl-ACP methyl ester carboxylesterase